MENKDVNYWIDRGNEFLGSENFEEAIKCYAKAAKLKPDLAEAFYKWGVALFNLAYIKQDETLHIKSFEKFAESAKLNPNNAYVFCKWGVAILNLANIKEKESLYEEAIEKLEKAVKLNSNFGEALYNWGIALSYLAYIRKDEVLYKETIEKIEKTVKLNPNFADALHQWGIALSCLAEMKQDESLYKEAIEKFEKTAELKPDDCHVFLNWGYALYDLAILKLEKSTIDDSLIMRSIEKFEKAASLAPNDDNVFVGWGIMLYYLAIFKKIKNSTDETLINDLFEKFYKESDSLKKCKKTILETIFLFGHPAIKKIWEPETYYTLLDSDCYDGLFFKEVLKNENDITIEEIDKYKRVYIISLFIISRLYVNNENGNGNENEVAHYTNKITLQKMLLEDSKFRLNAINYSNDPTEGNVLLYYLFGKKVLELMTLFSSFFDKEKQKPKEKTTKEYGTFAACFTFNYDSLNQFRLYGKENGEGTGLSLVFDMNFFSINLQTAMEQKVGNATEQEKLTLFRCMYIDPETQRVETIGHKEAYLFYREKGLDTENQDIDDKVKNYRADIDNITEDVRKNMKKLEESIGGLEPYIIEQLLINLSYLTKHVAFKEEQECRIVKIHSLDDKKIITEDFERMYVEYGPNVSEHIKKIYFGPKATDMELFQDILIHKGFKDIVCKKSTNPLA